MKAENNSFLIELAFSKSEQYTASPSSAEAFVQYQLPEGGFSKTFLPAAMLFTSSFMKVIIPGGGTVRIMSSEFQ